MLEVEGLVEEEARARVRRILLPSRTGEILVGS